MAMSSLFSFLAESKTMGAGAFVGDLKTELIKKVIHEKRTDETMPFEYTEHGCSHNHEHKVAVIGGGLAGLMAGWMLADQGYDVTVLEAQNRVGGRVDTRFPGQGPVEAGAELIGKIHARWIKLAHHFNLGLSPISTEEMYAWQKLNLPILLNGNRLTKTAKKALGLEITNALKQLNADANKVDPYEPWKCSNALAWDSMSVQDWINSSHTAGIISSNGARMLEYDLSTNQASPASQQSYLGLLAAIRGGSLLPLSNDLAPYWDDSETFRCSSGNQNLAEEMMQQCKNASGKVMMLQSVKTVVWEQTSWKIYTDREFRTSPLTADWVILAIPPSVWKNVTFGPASLAYQISQYQGIQMGWAVKYLAYVKERFWLSQGYAPAAEDTSLGIVWEGTDNQNLQRSTRKNLTVFAGGPLADPSNWGNAPDRYFHDELEKIYPEFKKNVDTQMSELVEWRTATWTECGYSCPSVGQVITISQHLASPLNHLVFAGEHTSTAFFGFMEGALESGLRAANHVFKGTGFVPI